MSATVPAGGHVATPGGSAPGQGDLDATLREQAIANLKRQRKFAADLVAYVTVNAVLWLVWALTDGSTGGGLPWPAWVSAIWGMLLIGDAWRAFGPWPKGLRGGITEMDIEHETERLRRGG